MWLCIMFLAILIFIKTCTIQSSSNTLSDRIFHTNWSHNIILGKVNYHTVLMSFGAFPRFSSNKLSIRVANQVCIGFSVITNFAHYFNVQWCIYVAKLIKTCQICNDGAVVEFRISNMVDLIAHSLKGVENELHSHFAVKRSLFAVTLKILNVYLIFCHAIVEILHL